MMDFESFCKLFYARAQNTHSGLILTHCLTDGDAAGAAIALKNAFHKFEIGIPDNPTKIARKIFNDLNTSFLTSPDPSSFDAVLVIDAGAPQMLGNLATKLGEAFVLDHHSRNPEWEKYIYFTDETRVSCSEIVFDMLKNTGIAMNQKIAKALVYGIFSDSAQFQIADARTFKTMGELVEYGIRIQDIYENLTEKSIDISQRISAMKGFQRLMFRHYKNFLIAGTIVSAHEGSVCNALVNAGADVAFVGSVKNSGFRMSGRLSNEALKLGLKLPEIFGKIASEVSLNAGGHDGAAGISGEGDVEFVLNACMEVAERWIRERA